MKCTELSPQKYHKTQLGLGHLRSWRGLSQHFTFSVINQLPFPSEGEGALGLECPPMLYFCLPWLLELGIATATRGKVPQHSGCKVGAALPVLYLP